MLNAISGVTTITAQPAVEAENPAVAAATPPRTEPAVPSHNDTVKLSLTQQVRNLRAEGEPASQIATSLALTTSQVTSDLYVSLTWPQLLAKVAASTISFGAATPTTAQG